MRPDGFLQSFQDSRSGTPATSGRTEAQVALIALVGCWCRVAAPLSLRAPQTPRGTQSRCGPVRQGCHDEGPLRMLCAGGGDAEAPQAS